MAIKCVAQIRKGIKGAKADHIQAIFITVDPKRDIPIVVKQFAEAFSPVPGTDYDADPCIRMTGEMARARHLRNPHWSS